MQVQLKNITMHNLGTFPIKHINKKVARSYNAQRLVKHKPLKIPTRKKLRTASISRVFYALDRHVYFDIRKHEFDTIQNEWLRLY